MITCPRTGRTWPPEHLTSLRDCVKCGGKIDIRHEAWLGGPNGNNPEHISPCPPARAMPVTSGAPAPTPKASLTGAEMLVEMGKYRDHVHEAWLNDPARRNQGGPTP